MSHTDPVASLPGMSPPPSRNVLVPIGQIILAAVGVYVAAESVSLGLWTALGPGPGLLPLVLGVALAGLTAIWAVQTLVARRATASDLPAVQTPADDSADAADLPRTVTAPAEEKPDRPYALGVVGGLLLLAAVMEFIGFQISMALFLFAELVLLGRQRWWIAAAAALIGSVGVFVLFDRVLAVQLPLSSIPFLSNLGL